MIFRNMLATVTTPALKSILSFSLILTHNFDPYWAQSWSDLILIWALSNIFDLIEAGLPNDCRFSASEENLWIFLMQKNFSYYSICQTYKIAKPIYSMITSELVIVPYLLTPVVCLFFTENIILSINLICFQEQLCNKVIQWNKWTWSNWWTSQRSISMFNFWKLQIFSIVIAIET